jgi:CheY-like chemotaxis protein
MIAMGRTIVVVEDSFDCAETLQIALESIAGVDIRVVASGQAALEFLARCGEDVAAVVTDLQMPRMSGLELQSRLRAEGLSTPIIFITAYPEERTKARALDAGAICFLDKPFDSETLIRCLDIARSQQNDSASE